MNSEDIHTREQHATVAEPERGSLQFRTINDFAVRLLSIPTQSDLAWYVAREVVGKLGFDDCVVYFVDPERSLLRQSAAIGNKNPEAKHIVNVLEIPFGQGITGHVAETQRPEIVDDLAQDDRYIPDLEPARSEICVPLIIDDETVGVIDCEDPRPGRFDGGDLEILTTVAAMTSAKLKLMDESRRVDERAHELRRLTHRLRAEIEERKHAEKVLKESEERYALAVRGSNDGLWDWNIRTNEDYFSPRWKELLGYSDHELEPHVDTFSELLHPEDLDRTWGAVQAHLERREPYDLEFRLRHKSGRWVWVRARGQAIWDDRGQPLRMAGSISDITERKQAERELRESEFRLVEAQRIARLGHWDWNIVGNELRWSDEIYRIFGLERREFGATYEAFMNAVHPDDREKVQSGVNRAIKEHATYDLEHRVALPSGEVRFVHERGEVTFDDSGHPLRMTGTVHDITDRKRAEERLAQAQKMEAVGQLTGGIAHDSNNLLAVVQGNAELLAEAAGADFESLTRPIIQASRRGAELTQRLLAFSRQQPLRPQAVGIGTLVNGMSDLLRRTLGATVEIDIVTDPDLRAASADPSQVESALLNLALNARDAMPTGGRLTIESRNALLDKIQLADYPEATAGDYVMLAVTDTGTGMSATTMARAFDPFFTTKEVGKGSGLGLSMVYGFAKQSGGHVFIESEEGVGTSVRLYLPRARGAEASEDLEPVDAIPRGQGETILVIEDDPDLRALAATMLEGLGYRVFVAETAQEAWAVVDRGEPLDLVLSDIVLPGGSSGLDFAAEVRACVAGLGVVFMSGYSVHAALPDGALNQNEILLKKPFRRLELAKVVRQALG